MIFIVKKELEMSKMYMNLRDAKGLLSLLIDMHVHTREESTGGVIKDFNVNFSIRYVDLRITYIPVLIEKNIL